MKQKTDKTEDPLGKDFWNAQWQNQTTGWDIGYAAPAVVAYMRQYPDKDAAILIPGCGNAYEAEYLAADGFTNITLIDIAPAAADLLRKKFKNTASVAVVCGDFFKHEGEYDLLIEQTFFCAIPPSRRAEYVTRATSLLKQGGKIIGLLFDRTFDRKGPPYGGSASEYKFLFESCFRIQKMEACYNSIEQRKGSELFVEMRR